MLKWMIEQSGGGMLVTQQVSCDCRTPAPSYGFVICSIHVLHIQAAVSLW